MCANMHNLLCNMLKSTLLKLMLYFSLFMNLIEMYNQKNKISMLKLITLMVTINHKKINIKST